jgi:acyl-CoA synthetase (AMP-forming)/AMP-acid ligase II
VGAIVVSEAGRVVNSDQVRTVAAQHLSSYKVPRIVLVVASGDLPMMSSGKVDRRALIRWLEDAQADR